jgi:hypothetical protein
MYARERGNLPRSRVLTGLALVYLVFAFIFIHTPLWGQEGWLGLPHVIAGFDKAILPLPRLLDILALAWLLASVPAISNLAKVGPNNPLAILGKHSLPVFILGTVFAMAAQVVKALHPTTLLDDAGLIATGIAARFMLAYGLEWVSRASRKTPAGAQLALVGR